VDVWNAAVCVFDWYGAAQGWFYMRLMTSEFDYQHTCVSEGALHHCVIACVRLCYVCAWTVMTKLIQHVCIRVWFVRRT
jgi:hypothetical protein